MKTLLISIAVLLSVTILKAQDEQEQPTEIRTLIGGIYSHGFYGALSAGYAYIGDRDALTIGGRAAWILNHRFAIGFGGSGFVTQFKYDPALTYDANFSGGYGGLFFEPIFFPESPVHFSVPVMIGAGGVAYAKKHNRGDWDDDWDNDNHHDYIVEEADPFAFIKPGVELELNLVKFVRVSVGAYYMYTSKVFMSKASSDMMNGFSGSLTFKFGKF